MYFKIFTVLVLQNTSIPNKKNIQKLCHGNPRPINDAILD